VNDAVSRARRLILEGRVSFSGPSHDRVHVSLGHEELGVSGRMTPLPVDPTEWEPRNQVGASYPVRCAVVAVADKGTAEAEISAMTGTLVVEEAVLDKIGEWMMEAALWLAELELRDGVAMYLREASRSLGSERTLEIVKSMLDAETVRRVMST
jgi:hypothetical protein